jgi:hypothetical protein
MEITANVLRERHIDVVWKIGIDAENPATLRPFRCRVEMSDLTRSMHTRIGAAGANGFDWLVGNDGDCLLNTILHADTRALPLPANVVAAVVLNTDCDAHCESNVLDGDWMTKTRRSEPGRS